MKVVISNFINPLKMFIVIFKKRTLLFGDFSMLKNSYAAPLPLYLTMGIFLSLAPYQPKFKLCFFYTFCLEILVSFSTVPKENVFSVNTRGNNCRFFAILKLNPVKGKER